MLGHTTHSRHPSEFTIAPVGAIEKLMKKLDWGVNDVDLFEINEAFAVVTLMAMDDLGLPHDKVNVFGGACANLYLNQPKRHPKADRPLMDWDLILIMQPMTIAGALLGSFVNKILPTIILTICLVALLAYTTHGTLQKGFAAFKKESDANAAKAAQAVGQETD